MHKVSFIIPAAGKGSRMKSELPKPFIELSGKPVIFHTLENVKKCRNVVETIVLLPPENFDELLADYGEKLHELGVSKIVAGGSSRQESVSIGLKNCTEDSSLIAVHDAVRPFANDDLFQKLFDGADKHGGALPVVQITDTVKEMEKGVIKKTVPREKLFTVQTPQVFKRDIFESAYKEAESLGEEITDDASIIEKAGDEVIGIEGFRFNIKLTTPEDLLLAEALINSKII